MEGLNQLLQTFFQALNFEHEIHFVNKTTQSSSKRKLKRDYPCEEIVVKRVKNTDSKREEKDLIKRLNLIHTSQSTNHIETELSSGDSTNSSMSSTSITENDMINNFNSEIALMKETISQIQSCRNESSIDFKPDFVQNAQPKLWLIEAASFLMSRVHRFALVLVGDHFFVPSAQNLSNLDADKKKLLVFHAKQALNILNEITALLNQVPFLPSMIPKFLFLLCIVNWLDYPVDVTAHTLSNFSESQRGFMETIGTWLSIKDVHYKHTHTASMNRIVNSLSGILHESGLSMYSSLANTTWKVVANEYLKSVCDFVILLSEWIGCIDVRNAQWIRKQL